MRLNPFEDGVASQSLKIISMKKRSLKNTFAPGVASQSHAQEEALWITFSQSHAQKKEDLDRFAFLFLLECKHNF